MTTQKLNKITKKLHNLVASGFRLYKNKHSGVLLSYLDNILSNGAGATIAVRTKQLCLNFEEFCTDPETGEYYLNLDSENLSLIGK